MSVLSGEASSYEALIPVKHRLNEEQRQRLYLVLSALLASAMTLQESAQEVVAAWGEDQGSSSPLHPGLRAVQMIVDGDSLVHSFGGDYLRPEEVAILRRAQACLDDLPSAVPDLLRAAAAVVEVQIRAAVTRRSGSMGSDIDAPRAKLSGSNG